MKILIIGYGKMGKAIENLARESDGKIVIEGIFNKSEMRNIHKKNISADVAIEFTRETEVLENITKLLKLKIPIVVGTTGWYQDDLPKVRKLVKKYNGSLIYGQNFSIGVNIFFQIIEFAVNKINNFEDYDIFGVETHHNQKADSPSGTALRISDIILSSSNKKDSLITNRLDRRIKPNELHFTSVRGGVNKGRHEIVFDSIDDEIRLTHQAWSRRGFAYGALLASSFISKNRGVYEFSEVFEKIAKLKLNIKQ